MLLLLVLVVVGWSTVYRAAWDEVTHTDYTVYRVAGQAAASGQNIYLVQNEHGWNYVYPPPFAVLMVPFAHLSMAAGAFTWYLMEILSLGLASWMSVRLLGDRASSERKPYLYALPILFLATLLVSGVQRCQASEFIIPLVIATFYFDLRGRPVLSGICLAAAAVVKVFPISLLAWLVLRCRWKAVAATLVAMVVMLLVLPSLYWGWDQNLVYLNGWFEVVGKPALMPNAERAHATPLFTQLMNGIKARNQSLEALFLTLRLSPSLAGWSARLVAGGMLVAMARAICGLRTPREQLLLASAFMIWQLLLPPVSETHYFGMMILPLTVILGELLPRNAFPGKRQQLLRCLAFLMIGVMLMLGQPPEKLRPLCIACVILWVWLMQQLAAARATPFVDAVSIVPTQKVN